MFNKILKNILLICLLCFGAANGAQVFEDYIMVLRADPLCPEWVMPEGKLGCDEAAEPSIKILFKVTDEILQNRGNKKYLEKQIEKRKPLVKNEGHHNYVRLYESLSEFITEKHEGTYSGYLSGLSLEYEDIRRYVRGTKLDEYINGVLAEMEPQKIFEDEHPDVMFAGYSGLEREFKCYLDGKVIAKPWNKSPERWAQALEYELHIAENQCSWKAQGLLSKELLSTIGGKYGNVTNVDPMTTLHASMAFNIYRTQVKTTALMKAHVGPIDLVEQYPEIIGSNEDLKLDEPLENWIKTGDPNKPGTNSDELLLLPLNFKFKDNHVPEIYELGVLLSNPNVAKEVCFRAWEEHLDPILKGIPSKSDPYQLYLRHAERFIAETFNFTGREYLRQLTYDYFIKLYQKAEQLLRYPDQKIKLKLRDCSGIDIFGNVGTCSYNALLELIRRNPDNAEFVSVGGMYDADKISDLAGDDFSKTLFKIYTEDGGEVSNCKEIKKDSILQGKHDKFRKLEEEIRAFVKSKAELYEVRSKYDDSYIGRRLGVNGENYVVLLTAKEYEYFQELKNRYTELKEEYNRFAKELVRLKTNDSKQKIPESMIVSKNPTNDLSSRIRTYLSSFVLQTNMNEVLKKTKLVKHQAKDKLTYSVYEMYKELGGQIVFLNSGRRIEAPSALHLLATDMRSGKQEEAWKSLGVDYRDVIAPLGIGFVHFLGEGYDYHANQWPFKKFFNETPQLLNQYTSYFLEPPEKLERP
jgi:hypothetical protein